MDDREVVRDEQVRQLQLALQVLHQVQHLRLHRDIERRGRLVADEELGIARQRPRNRDPLSLAAGKLVRILLAICRGQPHVGQQFADALDDRPLVGEQLVRPDRLGHDVADGPARIQARIRILEDHLHALVQRAPRRRAQDPRVLPGEANDAARRRVESDDHPRDRRFATARFADECQRLAGTNRQRDAVHRVQQPPALALDHAIEPRRRHVEIFGDVVQLDQRRPARRRDRAIGGGSGQRAHVTALPA